MHIEAGGNSIGFFMASEAEAELAGEALFACARAWSKTPFHDAVCEPELARGYATTPFLSRAAPDNLVRFLLPTGHASWVLRSSTGGAAFRLYWDICEKFVTLIGEEYEDSVLDAIDGWRAQHPNVTANWD
jgi:hypothetical protein